MKILYVPRTEGSRVVQFLHDAWGALMREGLWSKTNVLITGLEQCVFAMERNRIIGCLAFHVDEGVGSVITIAYVLPKHRGRGVYRALHAAFQDKSKEQGAKCLINICYPTNEGIQETCKKLGYHLYTQEWRRTT